MEDGVEKCLICVSRSSERNRYVLQCTNVHTCFYSLHILSRPLKHAKCQDTFESPGCHTCCVVYTLPCVSLMVSVSLVSLVWFGVIMLVWVEFWSATVLRSIRNGILADTNRPAHAYWKLSDHCSQYGTLGDHSLILSQLPIRPVAEHNCLTENQERAIYRRRQMHGYYTAPRGMCVHM